MRVAVFLLALGASSCASMFAPSSDEITIESEPQGATVTFRGRLLGTTPFKVEMQRQLEAPFITLRKDGYVTRNGLLERDIDGTAWFNFGFITTTSGAPSWGIDALSGKMFRYSQDSYVYELEKKGVTAEQASPLGFFIIHFAALQKAFTTGERGEEFLGVCEVLAVSALDRDRFWLQLLEQRQQIANAPHGLSLYRVVSSLRPSKEAT